MKEKLKKRRKKTIKSIECATAASSIGKILTLLLRVLKCVILNLLIGRIFYYNHRMGIHMVDHLCVFGHVFCNERPEPTIMNADSTEVGVVAARL